MPSNDRRWTRTDIRRALLVGMAACLGVVALCLVVLGTSQRQLQAGVLVGLWAALTAAFALFGPRRGQSEPDPAAELEAALQHASQLHESQLQLARTQQEQLEEARQAYFTQEIELRRFGELQLSRDAAQRREAELNLELSLRREIERVMSDQLGSLRDEVAALRAEVVDKLGGQLRLERIETTRLIGSDLEALQNEIRRLAGSQERLAAPARTTGQQQPVRPDPADIVDAELVEPRETDPREADPFAGLPRLSPLPEDLDLIPDDAARQDAAAGPGRIAEPRTEPAGSAVPADGGERRPGRRRAPDPTRDPEALRYQGRRRAAADQAAWFAGLER